MNTAIKVLATLGFLNLAACGADVVTSAATTAKLRMEEASQAQAQLDQAKQQLDAAMQQAETQRKAAEDAANK